MENVYNGKYLSFDVFTDVANDFSKTEVRIHVEDCSGYGTLQHGEEEKDLYERRENLWIQTWGAYEWEDWIGGLRALADYLEEHKTFGN